MMSRAIHVGILVINRRSVSATILLAVLLAAPNVWADPETVRIQLVQDGDFAFHLKCRKRASLADDDWLVLEMSNQTARLGYVDNVHYRIDYEMAPEGAGSWRTSGLCQGDDYECFSQDSLRHTWGHRLDGLTTFTVDKPLSNHAAAVLGYWPKSEIQVRCIAHLSLSVTFSGGKKPLRTPIHGIPFTFIWVPPDDAGFKKLEKRLRRWCEEPEDHGFRSYGLAGVMFGIPQVTDGLSDQEIQKMALSGKLFWRETTFAAELCLYQRDPNNNAMLTRYQKRLSAFDRDALGRLSRSPFWHADFSEPLIRMVERERWNRSDRDLAAQILEKYHADWENNADLVKRFDDAQQSRRFHDRLRFGSLTICGVAASMLLLYVFCRAASSLSRRLRATLLSKRSVK